MTTRDRPSPPRPAGNPGGPPWSAGRPEALSYDDDSGYSVKGDVVRFMWDYTVLVPLWAADDLLPDDPRWLRRALGLSDDLIRDLRRWGSAMNDLDGDPAMRTEERYRNLDHQARHLVERLQVELGSRFTVEYRPWVVAFPSSGTS